MKSYQYQLIRYVHDHFTGEFVNLGVVVYSPENNFLTCKTTRKYQRVASLFPDVEGRWVLKVLRDFENRLQITAQRLQDLFSPSQNLGHVTSKIIPNDDTAIRFSEVQHGVDVDLNAAMDDLFSSLIEKHVDEPKKDTLLDEDVWKEKYKQYFEQYGIVDRLNEHIVKVSDLPEDSITFNRAWKNEIWHCYEPLSFVVKKSDTVKNKILKWSGRLSGLRRAGEELHITLLVSFSAKHKKMLPLLEEYLLKEYNLPDNKLRVDFVTDDNAESLAKSVAEQMEKHRN